MLGALAEESVWGRRGLLAGRGTVGHQVPHGKSHSHFLTRGPAGFGRVPDYLVEESGISDAGPSAAGVAPGLAPEPGSLGLPHTQAQDAIAGQGQGLGERGGAGWGRILGQRRSFLSWAPSCRLWFSAVW